ncbi:MAG: ferritin-like domain-containing protein [Nostoc sp. DedSLP01]
MHNAKQASDLYRHLRAAIELEHSTIPLYLTALYSIKANSNQAVAEIKFLQIIANSDEILQK